MIDIYNISDEIIASVPITEGCEHVAELMSSDYVKLSYSSDSETQIPAGAYIVFDGKTYRLLKPYNPERVNEVEYKYEPEFQSEVMAWKLKPFFFLDKDIEGAIIGREADWTLTGPATDFLSAICASLLDELGIEFTYSYDASLTGTKSLSFSSSDIFSALNEIANIWNTEWWLNGTEVTLGKCAFGTSVPLEVGIDVGVPDVTVNNEGYYTRFYAFGSTRNITQDYNSGSSINHIVQKRLTLPKTTCPNGYKDIRNDLTIAEINVKVLVFDQIYPSSDLSISSVRGDIKFKYDGSGNKIQIGVDGNGVPIYETFSVFYFKIAGFTFDTNLIIEGAALSVHFNSGNLTGREFELKYHSDTEEYEILFDESSGYIIPNEIIIPADGDNIILFNIIMPSEYTSSAEAALETALDDEMAKQSVDLNTYRVKSFPVKFTNDDIRLQVGSNVTLINGSNTLETRVLAITERLDCVYQVEIEIGNKKAVRTTQQLKADVVDINKNLSIIKTLNDLTTTIQNNYSRTQILITEAFAAVASWFELVNPGLPNEYLRCKKSILGDKAIAAYNNNGQYTGSIWDDLPLATQTTIGGILLGAGVTKFLREDGTWQEIVFPEGSDQWQKEGTLLKPKTAGDGIEVDGVKIKGQKVEATETDIMVKAADSETTPKNTYISPGRKFTPRQKYGLLYTWGAINYNLNGASIAPPGWHYPTYLDFDIYADLGVSYPNGGDQLKTIGSEFWDTSEESLNNTGFSAKGSGYREFRDGSFYAKNSIFMMVVLDPENDFGYDGTDFCTSMVLSSQDSTFYYVSVDDKKRARPVRLVKNDSNNTGTMVDIDGNIYPTIKIGSKVFMAEDLRVTHYNDGTPIPEITDNTEFTELPITSGALCAYDNDWSNVIDNEVTRTDPGDIILGDEEGGLVPDKTDETYLLYYDDATGKVRKGVIGADKVSDGLVSGGIVTWQTGLTFLVSPAKYYINGQLYNTESTSITLEEADATNPRIDVIAVDNFSAVTVITGVPAENPVKPTADPSRQIELTYVLVPAGAEEPEVTVTSDVVYDENTEWTGAATGTTADFNSTTAPFHGTKCVNVTGVGTNDFIIFSKGSNIDVTDFDTLVLYIKLKAVMATSQTLYVTLLKDLAPIHTEIALPLSKSTINSWQNLSVSLKTLAYSGSIFNQVRLRWAKTGTQSDHTGFYIDYVVLQKGVSQPVYVDTDNYVNGISWNEGSRTLALSRTGNLPALPVVMTGIQGAQGVQGNNGAQGTTGGTGSAGTQGASGANGVQGSTGLQGVQGINGNNGSQGVQGLIGTQGTTGTGIQGTTGASIQGSAGANGSQGIQGITGTGIQGTSGINGSQGTTGSIGSQGTSGTNGTQGAAGSQGATGNSIQGSTGSQGATGTSVQGTQGLQGRQGTTGTGSQGAAGSQGTAGSNGAQGTSGTNGTQGSTGSQGTQGVTGMGSQGATGISIQGSTGLQGAQGLQGTAGASIQGSAGPQGSTGSSIQGATGSQGLSGSNGIQGSVGTQGSTGSSIQGAAGTNGSQGVQGLQGRQGTTGTGTQGTIGAQGSTGAGTQGTQGVQGLQGTQGTTDANLTYASSTLSAPNMNVTGAYKINGASVNPAFAKFWVRATANSTTIQESYNVTSVADTATGQMTVNIATDFAAATWCAQLTIEANQVNNAILVCNLDTGNITAGTVRMECWTTGATTEALADPTSWHCIGFGAQ